MNWHVFLLRHISLVNKCFCLMFLIAAYLVFYFHCCCCPPRLYPQLRRNTPSLPSSKDRGRTTDLRVKAATTADPQPTSCLRTHWAGVTEEAVRSLSSFERLKNTFSHVPPLGGRLNSTLFWRCSCKVDTTLSASLQRHCQVYLDQLLVLLSGGRGFSSLLLIGNNCFCFFLS